MSGHENNGAGSFSSSMTFASSGAKRQCDCDDCGAIPEDIMAAVRKRRRQMVESSPLKRTQERKLLRRDRGVSVWNLTMPLDAEPLIEFGSSHRLVWVKRLPEDSILKSIGKGIIGSSDEEKTREDLDWKEGTVYLVPSNGGKAVGWLHGAKPAPSTSPRGLAILNVIKIPLDKLPAEKLIEQSSSETEPASWVDVVKFLCQKVLNTKSVEEDGLFLELSKDYGEMLHNALKQIEDSNSSTQATATPQTSQPPLQDVINQSEARAASLEAMPSNPDGGDSLQKILNNIGSTNSPLKDLIG
jgi:hypothetical protein